MVVYMNVKLFYKVQKKFLFFCFILMHTLASLHASLTD